jgi:hypothetical protein
MALLGPSEYVHLVSSASFAPGTEEAIGQTLGRAVSVQGVLGALSAFNAATGNTARAEARKRAEAETAGKDQPTQSSSGLKGLLPFGFGGTSK